MPGKKIMGFIKEGRMDTRIRVLTEATIAMEKAIKLYSSANDTKVMVKHFLKVKNETINAARSAGITDRELKIIGLITKGKDNLKRIRNEAINKSTGIFANTWQGVTIKDVKKIAKDNSIKLKRAGDEFVYGFNKKNKLIFKYDQSEFKLYTDETLIDFMNKKFA